MGRGGGPEGGGYGVLHGYSDRFQRAAHDFQLHRGGGLGLTLGGGVPYKSLNSMDVADS